MRKLLLYTTSACHLCEQAEELVGPALSGRDLTLEKVDISGHDDLIDRYGIRIPVLRLPEDGRELGWPFDAVQLEAFLSISSN